MRGHEARRVYRLAGIPVVVVRLTDTRGATAVTRLRITVAAASSAKPVITVAPGLRWLISGSASCAWAAPQDPTAWSGANRKPTGEPGVDGEWPAVLGERGIPEGVALSATGGTVAFIGRRNGLPFPGASMFLSDHLTATLRPVPAGRASGPRRSCATR